MQHTLRQTFDEALRKQGVELSFAQFAALFNLHSDPGVTGARLARRAMVSAQTMNSALRALELDGYIERRPHPLSRRADSWSLTDAGLEELARARRVGNAIFARMLGDFRREGDRGVRGLPAPLHQSARRRLRGRRRRLQRRQNAGVSNTRNV